MTLWMIFYTVCLVVSGRREELSMKAQRRREANRERKGRMERRRSAAAEATRIKHEGPTMAQVVRPLHYYSSVGGYIRRLEYGRPPDIGRLK